MHPKNLRVHHFLGDTMNGKSCGGEHVYIENGKKIVEKTEARGMLVFLYKTWLGRCIVRPLVRLRLFSRLYGMYQSSWLSRFKIKKFIAKHAIPMHEYQEPPEGYASFNDFFCRKLLPDVRPINHQKNVLISPADAKCWVLPNVTKDTSFFVKQTQFSIQSFLRDSFLAEYFDAGTLVLFRLAPYDYHRFHAPVSGDYSNPIFLNGTLESVNPIAFQKNLMPLVENERHLILVHSDFLNCKIAIVPVGAMFVGKIEYIHAFPRKLTKGDELGYFAFGGSSIVLLFPHGVLQVRHDLVDYNAHGFELAVKMGEAIGTFI